MGLGYAELSAENPSLIYCSITGFGRTGAKAGHPAYDNVIQAWSGLMEATGTEDSGPIKAGPPILDYATGAQAAFAIAAALLRRERTGLGQRIDISMLDAAIMSMSADVSATLRTGRPPARRGNVSRAPGYGAYRARDGLVMLGAYSAAQHKKLYLALGLADLAESIGTELTVADMNLRYSDCNRIAAVISHNEAQYWENYLNDVHIPAARVRNLTEALESLLLLDSSVVGAVVREDGSKVSLPVAAFRCSEGGPMLKSPPPRPGQHTKAILRAFGLSEEAVHKLQVARTVI
jgi:crotonobetainyl-CoA:carnitine CoA-transferase CaiB-like acyl-CoA transferase